MRLRNIVIAAVGIVLLVLGWGIWHGKSSADQTGGSASGGGGRRGGPGAGGAPVPVVAGTVVQKDVPIYLDGLGTVQAFNTVTVHTRVDGQLKKVNFVEGQDVHAGDVLALFD